MEPGRKPPNRIDANGHRQVAHTWESLVDRQIRQAMEAGEFDGLPFQGERLPIGDDSLAGDRAMAYRVLRNAGAAPPWIEADREVRVLLERREVLFARVPTASAIAQARDRVELRDLVAAVNDAIARLNAEAPTVRQHRRPLVLQDDLARFDELARG